MSKLVLVLKYFCQTFLSEYHYPTFIALFVLKEKKMNEKHFDQSCGTGPICSLLCILVNILLSFIKRKQRIEFLAMVRLGSCQARIIALESLRSHQAIGTVAFKQVSYHKIV